MHRMLALLTTSLLSISAQADFDASVSLGGLTFELIDLDVNDGITPSITVSPISLGGGIYLQFGDSTETRSSAYLNRFAETSKSLSNGPLTGTYTFQGLDAQSFIMGATSNVDIEGVASSSQFHSHQNLSWYGHFRVTPHTLVKASAPAQVAANLNAVLSDGATSYHRVKASINVDDVGDFQSDEVGFELSNVTEPFTSTKSKRLTFALENAGADFKATRVYFYSEITQGVSPVPEPSTVVAWLAGLTLLARRQYKVGPAKSISGH